jgi:hypothetical protein
MMIVPSALACWNAAVVEPVAVPRTDLQDL